MVGRSWVIFAFGVLAGLLLSSISSPWTPWSNSGETSGATVPGVWASRSSSGSKSASLSSAASKTHHLINATYREEAARGDSNRVPRSNVGTATRAPTPVLRTTTSKAQSPFDLDSKEGLRAAVDQAATSQRELVLLTSDRSGMRAAVNMALQLRLYSIKHSLVLMGKRVDCTYMQRGWSWLACGWSHGLRGFERYRGSTLSASGLKLWALWSGKWLIMARLVELHVNVLALDTDMLVLADPYLTIQAPPVSSYAFVIVVEGGRINLGFMYARGSSARLGGGVSSVLWDVVRRFRLFLEQGDEWLLRDSSGRLSLQGVWDQGIFTDALKSAVVGHHIYPYTFNQNPSNPAWNASRLNWPPKGERRDAEAMQRMHHIEWLKSGRTRRPMRLWAPAEHPIQKYWTLYRPLLYANLRPLPTQAGLASNHSSIHPLAPGWLDPAAHNTAELQQDAGYELALAAPDWLYSTASPPDRTVLQGWPGLRNGTTCALVHLVELRSQFVSFRSLDTLKMNRAYVMAFYGRWLVDGRNGREPLDDPGEESAAVRKVGAPPLINVSTLRLLRLPESILEAASSHSGVGSLLNALQLLHLVAAVTRRVPVIPSISCSAQWLERGELGVAGVVDDYVLVRWEADVLGKQPDGRGAGSYRCHLAMGGARCIWPNVFPSWWVPGREVIKGSAETATASLLPVDVKVSAGEPADGVAGHKLGRGGGCNNSAAGLKMAVRASSLRRHAQTISSEPVAELDLHFHGPFASIAAGCWPKLMPQAGPKAGNVAEQRRAPQECSLPLVIGSHGLGESDESLLSEMHHACPAYFASRKVPTPHAGRTILDHMHRRRPIADVCLRERKQ